MRRRFAGICLVALLAAGAIAGSASAATSRSLTRIEAPRAEQVAGNGQVHVVLRSKANLSAIRVLVDGRSVKRFFHGSAGTYRAVLKVGHGVHHGVNDLMVVTRGSTDFDRVRFIVARRDPDLLTLRDLRVGGRDAPVRVVVRAATGSTLTAWVNGHRAEGSFRPTRRGYVGRLGANDGVRPGRNRLVVLVHRTGRSGRSATHDVESTTFRHKPGQVIAGAGPDRVLNARGFIELDGSAAGGGGDASSAAAVKHRWEIVGGPAKAATLQDATTTTPEFFATAPGYYRVRTTVTAPNGTSSADTSTVTVRRDVPPIGWRLDTTDDRGTVTLDDEPIKDTTWTCAAGTACASYAVFNRQTLQLVEAGNRPADSAGMKFLADKATDYTKIAPTYLIVVNLSGSSAELPDGKRLLVTLGVATVTRAAIARPISIVGVAGSPAGSAFISDNFVKCAVNPAGCSGLPQHLANMSGYLRLNPVSATGGYFEFVFDDQLEFHTDASAVPSQITMKVGDATYAHDAPTDGSAGFFLTLLNSQTLALDRTAFFVTNNPDRSENPNEEVRLADLLALASSPYNSHGELLVMLQAFGRPRGLDGAWLRAAAAIARLGGNAQVFAQLNQGNAAEPNQGRYAFVGRAASETAAAESSQSLTGYDGDGKLGGLIARGRDDQYQPLAADPGSTVNFDLVKIVNRPSPPDGGFPPFTPGEANAAAFLGRDLDVIGVCAPAPAPCDVRRAYYDNSAGVSWSTILTRLGNSATQAKCAKDGDGFTAKECNDVRELFEKEIGRRNTVEAYFGPNGLQAPFLRGAQAGALVDVAQISELIRASLPSFPADNAVSNVFSIMTNITKIAGLSALVCGPCGPVASALSGTFGLAAYLTKQDGSPVIGHELTAASAKLGGELFDRYQRVSAYFATEAKIIMSDGTKLSEVAAVATSDPKWKLGDISTSGEMIRLATKQSIYRSLIPVAYPVLYDLGVSPTSKASPFDDARQWVCKGDPTGFTYSKHLWQNTGADAQLKYKMTDSTYFGQIHVFAVGARHTVGSLHGAYVPAPTDSLTGPLFRDPNRLPEGGIGLFKLDLYSPQYFRVFPKVLQQDVSLGVYKYCSSMPNPPDNAGS